MAPRDSCIPIESIIFFSMRESRARESDLCGVIRGAVKVSIRARCGANLRGPRVVYVGIEERFRCFSFFEKAIYVVGIGGIKNASGEVICLR